MLPFESIDIAPTRAVHKQYRPPQLPLYVEPLPDEALLSWLLRLAMRLRVSMHTLAYYSFGADDRSGLTRWWLRPHPWVLARIGERTGVAVERLRKMTLGGYQPVYRDDEASARFCGRRYDGLAPDRRLFRFAVCGVCIEEDDQPYLRREWMIGWAAVCPRHNTQLIDRCELCGAGLRLGRWTTTTAFEPRRCIRCRGRLRANLPAHASVTALQGAMFAAKLQGHMDMSGLRQLTWREFIALADILLAGVWKWTTTDEHGRIIDLYKESLVDDPDGEGMYRGRHDGLRFLAWLLGGWPNSAAARVAQEMLRRWLSGDREFASFHLPSEWVGKGGEETYAIGSEVRARIQELHADLVGGAPAFL